MLSNKQEKLLRKIKRSKKMDITVLPESVSDDIWFLISQKLVSHHEIIDNAGKHTGQLYAEITPLGNATLSERQRENRHWSVPVVISIFAAIGGYREEIYQVAELIMTLLK